MKRKALSRGRVKNLRRRQQPPTDGRTVHPLGSHLSSYGGKKFIRSTPWVLESSVGVSGGALTKAQMEKLREREEMKREWELAESRSHILSLEMNPPALGPAHQDPGAEVRDPGRCWSVTGLLQGQGGGAEGTWEENRPLFPVDVSLCLSSSPPLLQLVCIYPGLQSAESPPPTTLSACRQICREETPMTAWTVNAPPMCAPSRLLSIFAPPPVFGLPSNLSWCLVSLTVPSWSIYHAFLFILQSPVGATSHCWRLGGSRSL